MAEITPKKNTLTYQAGMLVKVHQKIKEFNSKGEEKDRIQIFEGTIIAAKHGNEPGATITVRKISNAVGVEKIFTLFSPLIDKIELVRRSRARRSKLYYVREKAVKQVRRKMKKAKPEEVFEEAEVTSQD